MKNLIFFVVFLFSFSLYGQTVFSEDQIIYNTDDETIVLDKSNNRPITGVLEGYYESGSLNWKLTYIDGKKDGLTSEYYESKKWWEMKSWRTFFSRFTISKRINYIPELNILIKHEITFKDGKRDDLNTGYYENGNLRYQRTYNDGKQDGLVNEYYESGALKRESIWMADKFLSRTCFDRSGNEMSCLSSKKMPRS